MEKDITAGLIRHPVREQATEKAFYRQVLGTAMRKALTTVLVLREISYSGRMLNLPAVVAWAQFF